MEEIYIICKKINNIIIEELKENIKEFSGKIKFDKDIINIIEHFPSELEDAYELCLNGKIVSSMVLLRSTFENMLFSMNIISNEELLEKYKKIKNNIRPSDLKNEIIENWDKYFTDIMDGKEQTEIEIKSIYDILSKFIHVNCLRTTTCIIENDEEKLNVIKYLYIQNITSILLIYIDFINKYLGKENKIIYALFFYEIICVFTYLSLNVEKIKNIAKYNEYIYIHINNNEIEKYKDIINKDINIINDIDEKEKIISNILTIINVSKYSKEIEKLNIPLKTLINKFNKK